MTRLLISVTLTLALSAFCAESQEICDQFGSTTVSNRYVVMNNRWGTELPQCIVPEGTGFRITRQDGTGTPASYPAIFFGCHYTNCSPGTNIPRKLADIRVANSRIAYNFVDGPTYNAAYDIWVDPQPLTDGVNTQEIMIWLKKTNPVQPIGSQVGTVNLAGKNWDVWTGDNGVNKVISYVAQQDISGLEFNMLEFFNDCKARGLFDDQWYLTSVQAGFEPWNGGVGLAVTDFSVQLE